MVWPFDCTIEVFGVKAQSECSITLGSADQRVNPVGGFIYFGYDALLDQCLQFLCEWFTQYLEYSLGGRGGGVNDWWNSGDQGNVELSFETADAFKTVLVLAKKVLLCICTSGGEAAIESNKFRIPAGREAQNRRSICVHNVK